MSRKLKKILVTGASLLMLTSIGAGITNVKASHTVSVPSQYWGRWEGHEFQQGIHRGYNHVPFYMRIGRRNGYYEDGKDNKGSIVYTKAGKAFRHMGLRYYYWPDGMVNDTAPVGFGLHGHTLYASMDTTTYHLHRLHYRHYIIKHHRKSIRIRYRRYSHRRRLARKHFRRSVKHHHIHKSHRRAHKRYRYHRK